MGEANSAAGRSPRLLPPILYSACNSPGSSDSKDVCVAERVSQSRYHSGCVPRPTLDFRYPKPSVRTSINADSVALFLDNHRTFLDKYVLKSISMETLERWILRKSKLNCMRKSDLNRKKKLYRYSMNVHSDKRELFQNVLENIKLNPTQEQVLYELGFCISSAVGVDGFNVFTITEGDVHFMNVFVGSPSEKPVRTVSILKSSLPMVHEVVKLGKPMRLAKRNGVAKTTSAAVSSNKEALYALYLPIVTPAENTTAVLEMWRMTNKFYDYDEEIASSYLVWGSIALHYVHLYMDMMKQRKLQDYLLHVAESIFEDMGSMEILVEKIMHFAQELVHADRASLFLVDSKTKELYATVFDVGVKEKSLDKDARSKTPKEEIRFPIGVGIAGYVAKTGQILNIKDAYTDDRFNSSVDLKTGYRTKSILCMPVYIRNSVIGVVQMVNKRGDAFNASDVEAFKMFATYCGLALHHAKLYNKIRRSEQKYKVAIEVLSYHNTCREDEVNRVLQGIANCDVALDDFYLNPYVIDDVDKVKDAIRMFEDLFQLTRFDSACLARFVLTVKKNYRQVPYHNWSHGFSVANCMYNILQNDDGVFSQNERLALYIGSLCHDLDHRGKNNKFMLDTESPLAAMYSTSTMEHHHFNQTVLILQQDGHNIFSQLTNTEFKHLLSILKHCILATDLAAFFPNRALLQTLVSTDKYDWEKQEHRWLALAISMTAADLSAAAKPWKIQTETVRVIFEEFYDQGDAERAAGRVPIPMMDRHKPEEQAASQVGFLKGICLPCYELLQRIIPRTEPLQNMCQQNLERWSQIDTQVRRSLQDGSTEEQDLPGYVADLIAHAE